MSINHSLPASMTVIQSLTEYRGLSYSSGGDLGAFTIPNYIRHYQKDVTGYSVGNHTIEYCRGMYISFV
jgi:phospholipase B1